MNQFTLRVWVAAASRYRQIRTDVDERGLTTTEIAVLTFVLVTAAVGIGALLYSYASGQVEALPDVTRDDIVTGDE